MIEITIDSTQARRELGLMMARVARPNKLMAGIAAELLSHTEDIFAAEGQPKWEELAASTIMQRARKGTWPGKILQVSTAGLAASIQTAHTDTTATIGSNKVYAAIQHLGGEAGRNKTAKIPERPYLPTKPGSKGQELTERAEKSILEMVVGFIERG